MIINYCQISSCIFIINTILGIYCNYIIYSLLFFCLFITSIIHHTYKTDFTYIIDQVSVLYVVLYGGLLFYQKLFYINNTISFKYISMAILIIVSFLLVNYIYYYGYYSQKYSFDIDTHLASKYHALMHYISSFGHILIMLL